jgi:chromosomal replication initiation ATPase DnaA
MSWEFWIKVKLSESEEKFFVLEQIRQIILRDGLRTKSRKRNLAYSRACLYTILRDYGFTFEFIGKLFSKDHATVINGIRIWNEVKDYPDAMEIGDKYEGEIKREVKFYRNTTK